MTCKNSKESRLNAYTVGEKDGDWAMLVFARTAKEARKISYGAGWHAPDIGDWPRWEARRIWDLPAHLAELDTGDPQVVEDPPGCDNCECWGGLPLSYGCTLCLDEDEVPD